MAPRGSGPDNVAVLDRPRKTMALLELIEQVANCGDQPALGELLFYRPVFRFDGKGSLPLPDYVTALWEDRCTRGRAGATELLDRARDLTLDKFSSLEDEDHGDDKREGEEEGKRPGRKVNCRKYYAAVLERINEDERYIAARGELQRERIAAPLLQRFVNYHFHLSYKEARRKANPFISRYTWRVNGAGKLTLWMPKYLKGRERGAWLKKNVDDPDPGRPGERDRVQALIDRELCIPRFVPFDPKRDSRLPGDTRTPDVEDDSPAPPSFVSFLAREKAASVDLQRPAIRELGPERIERLVTEVVRSLSAKGRSCADIAREFGLSKTALSHFAGTNWKGNALGNATVIPDLWRNAAVLLSQSEVFCDLGRQAGILETVKAIASQSKAARLRGIGDES